MRRRAEGSRVIAAPTLILRAEQAAGCAISPGSPAVARGMVTGKAGNVPDPQAGAARAETAAMLQRLGG